MMGFSLETVQSYLNCNYGSVVHKLTDDITKYTLLTKMLCLFGMIAYHVSYHAMIIQLYLCTF